MEKTAEETKETKQTLDQNKENLQSVRDVCTLHCYENAGFICILILGKHTQFTHQRTNNQYIWWLKSIYRILMRSCMGSSKF